MPIYEYTCEKCQATEEILQNFGEDSPDLCPTCKARGSLKRAVSHSAFHLKGGGWYKDLYSSSKEPVNKENETKKAAPVEEKKDKLDKADKPEKVVKKDTSD
jgi:putative FmdB family regulatory protein